VTEIVVHLDRTRQTIEGFGGALITFGSERKEHYDPQFYDIAVNDLGVSMIRLPMPDFFEPFNDDDDPDNFNWDGFKVKAVDGETGLDYRMMILQEFKKRGVERFMASPWSAPAFTKSDRTTRNSGYLRMDKSDEFAEFMAAFIIMAKHNWDIDIGAVTLQNELLFNHTFGSGLYSAYHLREATRSVMRKFKKEGINTLMLLPEDMTSVTRLIEYMQPVMDDPETKHYPGHLASHRQDGWDGVRKWREHTAGWNRQNWMTETSGHPQTWPGAIQMASDMHSYLVGGDFSAWVYWQLTDNERSGQYAIMVDYQPTPKFYAARHFYRYIRPGAVRVETTPERGDILPSVFRHDTRWYTLSCLYQPGDSIRKCTYHL
jgi:glucuronoarabinoxylan endo-1,4-beta-xylanase